MIQEKPIIATWGIGPSYRKRVKQHIIDSVESGYDNIMEYSILTDYPEDFDDISKETGKIKFLTNIHEVRKNFQWSIDREHIPNFLDYENYGKQYVENNRNNKHFSYGLHRYALPDLAAKGYTKILFIDPDMKINYEKINVEFSEEEFWSEFNTPINSVKGCVAETIAIKDYSTLQVSRCMGHNISIYALQICTAVLLQLDKIFNENKFRVLTSFDLTEGPFRFYNFRTSDDVTKYFQYWEESQKIIMTNDELIKYLSCGGYMYCDYLPVACANISLGLSIENFSNIIYDIAVHYEDRYFLPRNTDATLGLPINPAENLDEFLSINKETLETCTKAGAWPNIDPKYIYNLKDRK